MEEHFSTPLTQPLNSNLLGFVDDHGVAYAQSVERIWFALLDAWCTIYIGLPNKFRDDQGSAFTSDRWREITSQSGIQILISGVKAHPSLRTGERLHEHPRRIYL